METHITDLSSKQAAAIELILSGMKDGEVAERVGVNRKTINRWRTFNEDFRAALITQRKIQHEQHQDGIHGLVSEAIDVMREAMRNENALVRLRAAQAVLHTSGLQTAMKAEKPASREEILQEFLIEMIGKTANELGVKQRIQIEGGE